MSDWCATRNMSWDAVNEISRRWELSFHEVPVAGHGFYEELAKIRNDWSKHPIPHNRAATDEGRRYDK